MRTLTMLALCAALPTLAQAPPQGGQPTLAPHPPRLTVTPPDRVPLDRLRLPPGFHAELWAHSIPGARMMAQGDRGTLFVGTRAIGRVYAVTDEGGTRRPRVIAERLIQPNGVAFRDGSLFVGAINRVLRFDQIESRLDAPGEPADLTAAFGLPSDLPHGWKFFGFDPQGRLTMNVGVPCNICAIDDDRHGLIVRYNPDGSGRTIVARGVRNSVGFDWQPGTGTLWFTNNGRDWSGDDRPHDTLHRVGREGEHHGFPWCHDGDFQDPEMNRGRPCSEFVPPVLRLGPHVAALGMRFYTGAMFPAAYRGNIFIARRGSWNRTAKIGYDVVRVIVGADGSARMEPFLTGFLDGERFHGRPVDVHQLPDGSLLVSDEENGAIYRITWQG